MAIPTILKQPVNYLQAAYNKIMYCFRSTNYTAPTPTEVAINLSQQIGNDPTYYAVQDGNTVEFLGVTFTFRSFNPPSPSLWCSNRNNLSSIRHPECKALL